MIVAGLMGVVSSCLLIASCRSSHRKDASKLASTLSGFNEAHLWDSHNSSYNRAEHRRNTIAIVHAIDE